MPKWPWQVTGLVVLVSAGLAGARLSLRQLEPLHDLKPTTIAPPPASAALSFASPASQNSSPSALPARSQPQPILPKRIEISGVPFIEQAPQRNWDEVHEETCEEATLLEIHHFLKGDGPQSADAIEAELQKMISWQLERLGTFTDTTASQTARILKEYFGYGDRVRVIEDASLNDLKAEVAAGRPVIVPAAGRLLGNKYFKTPGPIYHMTVVIGYTPTEIITNDPGTKRGQGYRYPTARFWSAVHDFVDKTDEGMARGAQRLIVVD